MNAILKNMISVMNAFQEGYIIERAEKHSESFFVDRNPSWDWASYDYRINPCLDKGFWVDSNNYDIDRVELCKRIDEQYLRIKGWSFYGEKSGTRSYVKSSLNTGVMIHVCNIDPCEIQVTGVPGIDSISTIADYLHLCTTLRNMQSQTT